MTRCIALWRDGKRIDDSRNSNLVVSQLFDQVSYVNRSDVHTDASTEKNITHLIPKIIQENVLVKQQKIVKFAGCSENNVSFSFLWEIQKTQKHSMISVYSVSFQIQDTKWSRS